MCRICNACTCGCSSECGHTSKRRAARLTWIRASMSNVPRPKKVRPKPTMGRWAITRCLRFGRRKGNCSSVICGAAVPTLPGTSGGSCGKHSNASRPRRSTYLRADSGFYSKVVVEWCEAHGFHLYRLRRSKRPRYWLRLPSYRSRAGDRSRSTSLTEVAELRYQPTSWTRPYRYVVKRELAETQDGRAILEISCHGYQ